MQAYLAELASRPVNFVEPPVTMTEQSGWTVDGHQDQVGLEKPGPPEAEGMFERARRGMMNYDFSDPSIAIGHFDPNSPFVNRNILLELKVFGFRFLGGARVHSVREESGPETTVFGFRYDTLQGHIERGFEWFLLTKEHASGKVSFRIEAHWRLGDFPNWWSRLGFKLFGGHFRRAWRERAPRRLSRLAAQPVPAATAPPGRLAHRGGDDVP